MIITRDNCRTCLKNNGCISLYANLIENITIADCIISFTKIKIMKDDQGPKAVCMNCFKIIKNMFIVIANFEFCNRQLKKFKRDRINELEISEPDYSLQEDIDSQNYEESESCSHVIVVEPNKVSSDLNVQNCSMPNDDNINMDIIENETSTGMVLRSRNLNQPLTKGGRPFKCGNCEKSFARSQNLRIHERMHTGGRPFKCGNCEKSFARAQNLRIHEWMHTGGRPFKCGNCEKSFAMKNHLKLHERVHTGFS